MEPGTGGEKPRSGRAQGAFMTRSREAELTTTRKKKKKKKRTHRVGIARRVRA
jgi:hypothetical protein